MADFKVANRLTGKLETLSEEEADKLVSDPSSGYDYPDSQELETGILREKYGDSIGQAAAESFVRTATGGLIPGFGSDEGIEGREKVYRNDYPVTSFGTQALGTIAPALAGGAVARLGVGVLGLGARAAGVAGVAGEALAGGYADEKEQARYEERPASVGNIILSGIAGVVVGRLVPAASKKLISLGRTSLEKVESAADNVFINRAKVMESRSVDDAINLPPGPERDTFLRDTAKEQYEKISTRTSNELTELRSKVDEVVDLSKHRKVVDQNIPETTKIHEDYRYQHVNKLRQVENQLNEMVGADKASNLAKKAIRESYENLNKADGATDMFLANARNQKILDGAINKISNNKAFAGVDDSVRTNIIGILKAESDGIHGVLSDKPLFGEASSIYSDVRALQNIYDNALQTSQSKLGGKDGKYNPSKIKSYLQGNQDELIGQYSDILDKASDLSNKYDFGDRKYFSKSKEISQGLRKESSLSNELYNLKSSKASVPDENPLKDFAKDAAIDFGLGMIGGPYAVAARKGIQAIRTVGNIFKATRSIDRASGNALKSAAQNFLRPKSKYIRGALDAADKASGQLKYTAPIMRSAVLRFQGDHPTPLSSYEEKRQAILDASNTPEVLNTALVEALGDLPRDDNALALNLTKSITQKLGYIRDNLPPAVAVSIQFPDGLPPSQGTIRDFAMLWNSVMDPMTVIEDFENRTVSPIQMKYLRESDEETYMNLKNNVVTAISQNYALIPSQAKKQMDTLFESDGMAGPAFSSQAAEFISEAINNNVQQIARGGSTIPSQLSPPTALNNLKTSVSNYKPS